MRGNDWLLTQPPRNPPAQRAALALSPVTLGKLARRPLGFAALVGAREPPARHKCGALGWRVRGRVPPAQGTRAARVPCLLLCRGRGADLARRSSGTGRDPQHRRARRTNPESGARFFENSCTRNRKSRLKRRLFSLLDNIGGIFRFCSTQNTPFSSLPERDRQPLFGVFDGK